MNITNLYSYLMYHLSVKNKNILIDFISKKMILADYIHIFTYG